jgi:EpsD family peptidyl-prolyl cis-trans isomerase
MRVRLGLRNLALLAAIALAAPAPASALTGQAPKLAAGGKTQVVAKAAGREITLSELRAEMSRLGLSPSNPGAEKAALENILNRALLAEAARKAEMHRRPEAMARLRVAEEQALAEMYLAYAAQPPEPTRSDIDDYIRLNPSLFVDRRVYEFTVLTLPTRNFDERTLTPLFDSESDFSRLAQRLDSVGVAYSLAGAVQSSAAFPKPIREQLARYGVSDNIVVKGESDTQIMKILKASNDSSRAEDWPALARRLLLDEETSKRAEAVMQRLKREGSVAYYRASAAPLQKSQ